MDARHRTSAPATIPRSIGEQVLGLSGDLERHNKPSFSHAARSGHDDGDPDPVPAPPRVVHQALVLDGLTEDERALLRSTRPVRDPIDVLQGRIPGDVLEPTT